MHFKWGHTSDLNLIKDLMELKAIERATNISQGTWKKICVLYLGEYGDIELDTICRGSNVATGKCHMTVK
jgi:hypothetical protein